MSRRIPSWLQFCVISLLVLQSIMPILPASSVPFAQAQGIAPDRVTLPSVVQPEQALPAEVSPAAPIPPAEPRLPQGRYTARLASDGRATHFADLPLAVTDQAGGEGGDTSLSLEVLAPEVAVQLSPAGVAFTLALSPTVGTAARHPATRLQLALDYGQLNLPTYGASFAERLTLYRGLGCQVDTGTLTCRAFVPLPGVNDAVNDRLTVDLDEQALLQRLQPKNESPAADEAPAGQPGKEGVNPESENGSAKESDAVTAVAPPPPAGETAADWLAADLQSQQAAVYVLAASSSGEQGDFAATPFTGNSNYQLSLAVGAMQTSYAVPLPPAAGGLAPDVTLAYDSGSVDGMTLNKNNQPGWVGIGWHYEPGSITRRLKTCGLTQAPGDLCLTGDNYVLALNGVSSPLVKDASGLYHPQSDPRWKIQKLTNGPTGHPDTHKEYWLVTTPDGVKYRFGGEIDPDKTTNNDQDSAFFTPVYDSTCSSVSAYWVCNKAWKWNLDRIEDPNGNVVAFYYQQEINHYNARTFIRLPYTRAGNVAYIEYGRRVSSATVPTQIKFTTAARCEAPCLSWADYPDTPGDLSCEAAGTCSQNKPTFWSAKRLDRIEPQYWDTSANQWTTVAQYALSQEFVKPPNDPNGAANEPKLWLNSITQKNAAGTEALPAVQYGYVLKQNRRDNGSACTPTYCPGNSSLTMPRVNQITDPLGGVTAFTYDQSHQCPIVSSGFTRFPYDCFITWNPAVSGFSIFNKWKVMSVTASDSFSGNPPQTTTYSYSTPINHYDDDPVTPSSQKSWGDFRGSEVVTETDASGAKTEHRFYRGMNGDYTSSGTTYITLSDGSTRADENWLRGREVETRRLKANDTPLTRSVNWPTWTLTAGNGASGAYFIGTQAVEETTIGSTNKTTRAETTYDGYGNVLTEVLKGDTATSADDRYVQHGYVYNTTDYIVDTPQWQKLYAGTGEAICTTYTSTDVPKTISASGTPTIYSTLTVPDSGLVTDVNVLGLNGTHTYINDLIFTLISPINAQTILMNRACGSQDNFNINFDDESPNAAGTWPCPPTNGGTYRPAGSLATFDGSQLQGTWTLKVQDVYTNDGGSLNGWQLQICRTPPAGDPLAFSEYAYDGQAIGAAPLKGNQTLARAYSQVTPTAAYVETTTAYDAYGRPTTVTDPNDHTTTTAYHPFYGYAQSMTNALSQTSSTVVDPGWGAPTSVTDLNGRVTTAQYDTFGRLSKVWLPSEPTNGPASKEFVYAPAAQPAWIKTRQLNDAATSSYLEGWGYFDGFGRSLQSQAPLANGNRSVTATGYNALGQTAYSSAAYEVTGAAGSGYVVPTWTNLANYAYTTYDELGRTVRNETRSGATPLWATRATYDVWTASGYDANDHRQDAVTDAFGQTTQVLEYNTDGTYTTNYAYDLAGRLTGVTDAANNVTTIGYDLLGRKTGMTDPDMGSWQYGYDNAGNLTSQRDGANRWLYLEYDARNRLVRKRQDSSTGPVLAEWQYDAAGQLGLPSKSLAYSSQGTTEVWAVAYDVLNRPLQQQYTIPGTGGGVFRFDTTYTTLGARATLRYPGGNAGQQGELVTFGYNTVGQLTSVTGDDGTQYVASTIYNAQGQVTEQRLDSGANGFTRQYSYNANTLRLETLKAGTAAPFENLQKLAYTYDLAGNVQSLTDAANSGQVQSFGYDWLDRLTTAATSAVGIGQYSHTYQYNAIGNITSYNGNAYSYGSQPHAVTTAFGNSYGYDPVGNQTSRTVGGMAYTQSFDYDSRLLGVAGGSLNATFLYDAEGNRVKGTVAGVTTVYIAGLYEWQNGAVTKYYEGGAFRRVGYSGDNGVFYAVSDQIKSTSALVNQDGTVNSRNYYYPYGGNRGGSAFSGITTKRFTGQYHEQGLPGGEGLAFYNARWYDSQLGVFISADTIVPDPLSPQSFNRYAYAIGNPLRFQDPTGHRACDDDDCLNSGPVVINSRPTAPKPNPYGIRFTASKGVTWHADDVQAVLAAAARIASQLRRVIQQQARLAAKLEGLAQTRVAKPAQIFRRVMGPVTVNRSAESCAPEKCWAWYKGNGHLEIYSSKDRNYGIEPGGYTSLNAGHEFGHFFDARAGSQPRQDWAAAKVTYTNQIGRLAELPGGRKDSIKESGFASGPWTWQQSVSNAPGEIFADMFLGWTYNHFADNAAGAARYDWMETHMAGWIELASQ